MKYYNNWKYEKQESSKFNHVYEISNILFGNDWQSSKINFAASILHQICCSAEIKKTCYDIYIM